MNWQTLILINVFLYSLSVLLQRTVIKGKESDPWSFSIIFQFLVGILIWVYTYLAYKTNLNLTVPFYHPNLILMTLLWASANIFIYNALKVTEASTFTILFSTRALFTVLASSLFLKEFVSLIQFVGILLILLGVVIVSYSKSGIKLGRKEWLSLGAAMCVGFANVNDRAILKMLDVQTYSVISYLFPAFFLLLLRPRAIKKFKSLLDFTKARNTLLLGILWVGFSLTFNSALKIAPSASQVSAIGLTSVIVVVVLSILILKEKDNVPRKIIGALVSFVGLFMVS